MRRIQRICCRYLVLQCFRLFIAIGCCIIRFYGNPVCRGRCAIFLVHANRHVCRLRILCRLCMLQCILQLPDCSAYLLLGRIRIFQHILCLCNCFLQCRPGSFRISTRCAALCHAVCQLLRLIGHFLQSFLRHLCSEHRNGNRNFLMIQLLKLFILRIFLCKSSITLTA